MKQEQSWFYSSRVFVFLQACPQGSKNFRDVQCGEFNGRDIFINGERATWKSYVRGIKVKPSSVLKLLPNVKVLLVVSS